MAKLVTYRMAASLESGDLAAGGVFGEFMSVFPCGDFRGFEAQFFVAQYVKLDTLRTFHFLHASICVEGIRA